MTETRGPRVFAADDPKIFAETLAPEEDDPAQAIDAAGRVDGAAGKGASIGGIFISAVAALVSLALMASVANFVSAALARKDWIGWTATSLAVIALVTGLALIVRELIGLVRLGRLTRLRRDADTALRTQDRTLERKTVRLLSAALRGRRDMAWSLARLRDHAGDVRDPGELLRLADR